MLINLLTYWLYSFLLFLVNSSIITQKFSCSGHFFKEFELDAKQSEWTASVDDSHWWHVKLEALPKIINDNIISMTL